LIANTGEAKLQPVELTETGSDNREFHKRFLTRQSIKSTPQLAGPELYLVRTNPGRQTVSTKHATLGLRPTPKRTRIHRHRATSHPPAHCWTICQLSNSQQDADLPNAGPDIRLFLFVWPPHRYGSPHNTPSPPSSSTPRPTILPAGGQQAIPPRHTFPLRRTVGQLANCPTVSFPKHPTKGRSCAAWRWRVWSR